VRFIYAVYLVIIAVLFALLLLFGGPGATDEVNVALTTAGILYAIFAGFFLSNNWSRLVELKESVVEETSFLELAYRITSRFKDRKGAKRLSNAIKEYVNVYTFLPWQEIHKAEKQFNAILQAIFDISTHGNSEESGKDEILDEMRDILKAKAEQRVLSVPQINIGHWIILWGLSAVIIFALFYSNANLVSTIIAMMFIPPVMLVLFLLYDLDNLMWGLAEISTEPYTHVLEVMGEKLPKHLRPDVYKAPKHETSRLFKWFYSRELA
jgi:hypothetical protein